MLNTIAAIQAQFDAAKNSGQDVKNAIAGLVAKITSILGNASQLGTSYVFSSADPLGPVGVGGGVNIIELYNLAASGIAVGARVNQGTEAPLARRTCSSQSLGEIDVSNLVGFESPLLSHDTVTGSGPGTGAVGVGGYLNALIANNYARSYIDDLAVVTREGEGGRAQPRPQRHLPHRPRPVRRPTTSPSTAPSA